MKARFQHPFGVPKQSPVLWAGIQPPFTYLAIFVRVFRVFRGELLFLG